MAIEGPNIFVAGARLNGVNGALAVLGGRGVVAASFARSAAGVYSIALEVPIALNSLLCLGGARDAMGLPLMFYAEPFFFPNPTQDNVAIDIRITDAAGAPADGVRISLAVFRSQTDV